MTHILTLIGAPGSNSLDEATVERISACLPDPGPPRWLAASEACEIAFQPDGSTDTDRLEHAVRDALRSAPVDIAIQLAEGRRRKLLVADMDSTIIRQECIDEIADFAGLKAEIAAITDRAMRGELEFESALRERVSLLAGLDEGVLSKVYEERIELTPGARTLVQTMRADGAFCALVSGGFTFFTTRVAAAVGFDTHQANSLDVADGKLTGHVCEPIRGQTAKLGVLSMYEFSLDLDTGCSLAVGDGANDLEMIRYAGLGVAFHAKPVVAARADVRIDHGDLTALLYLQGYAREDFVTDA